MQETTVSFRSAYMMAKEKMSYRKLPAIMILQKLKGANVGNVNKSDHACAENLVKCELSLLKKLKN